MSKIEFETKPSSFPISKRKKKPVQLLQVSNPDAQNLTRKFWRVKKGNAYITISPAQNLRRRNSFKQMEDRYFNHLAGALHR